MEKKNLIVGIIATLIIVGALFGLKMYKEGAISQPGQPGQSSAPSQHPQNSPGYDPYSSYSAPTQQQQ